MHLSKNKALVY